MSHFPGADCPCEKCRSYQWRDAPKDLNAFPEYPDCMFCSDHGVTFDEFNGYRWCTCPAGLDRMESGPHACYEANAARAKVKA
jgi:hypothetical protein